MKINAELIKKFNPCKDRFDNFLSEYPGFNDEYHEFLNLDRISYNDKIWVSVRLLDRNQLVHWSIMCAESVKVHFDAKYPENKALDNLFEYLKSGLDFTKLTDEQRSRILELRRPAADAAAADAAAAAADADAAAYAYAAAAADAAAYAAADAAAADAAAYAAADAADAAAADAAAYAAADAAAAAAREEQRNLNLLYLASVI